MPRFHFDISENGRFIPDEEGREFAHGADVRKEAVTTGASIARDAFVAGAASRIVVDVREDGMPLMKVSITLDVEEPAEG
jgi:uncharacterized protein DUF6894